MLFRFQDTEVSVNIPSYAALREGVSARLRAREGFALATINLDHVVKLQRSAPFRTAYAAQDFVTADGNPIVWLARLAGHRVDLLPGSDLVVPLACLAGGAGVPVALCGSTPDALAAAADGLVARVPGLRICARVAPPFGFDPEGPEADAVLDQIADSGAGLCFLALGAPKQEILAARGRERAPQVGFVSIGAGLDFIAGSQTRAPRWVQRIAMEWAWRLTGNPARLAGRYARCFAVLPGQAVAALRQRRPL